MKRGIVVIFVSIGSLFLLVIPREGQGGVIVRLLHFDSP